MVTVRLEKKTGILNTLNRCVSFTFSLWRLLGWSWANRKPGSGAMAGTESQEKPSSSGLGSGKEDSQGSQRHRKSCFDLPFSHSLKPRPRQVRYMAVEDQQWSRTVCCWRLRGMRLPSGCGPVTARWRHLPALPQRGLDVGVGTEVPSRAG